MKIEFLEQLLEQNGNGAEYKDRFISSRKDLRLPVFCPSSSTVERSRFLVSYS